MKLNERVLEGELMDAPDLATNLHYSALKGLQRVNRLSGTAQVLSQRIASAFNTSQSELRMLDLACGGGDVTVALAEQLERNGIRVRLEGWDRSETAVAFARERCSTGVPTGNAPAFNGQQGASAVTFHQREFADLDVEGQYDVVMCTLFLHHLNRTEALDLLTRMYRASRGLVLIDDLRRTWLGYRLAQLGCYVLSRSPIVHVDGPLSVRAAFTEAEVEELSDQAGLPRPNITRHWPQRFLACWQRADSR